jgi:hypothetical protein
LKQTETINGSLPEHLTPRTLTLHAQLLRPTGFVAAEDTFEWKQEEDGGQRIDEMNGIAVPKE